MLSSALLSAASATFTNASPHMMIVSAASRSMRCSLLERRRGAAVRDRGHDRHARGRRSRRRSAAIVGQRAGDARRSPRRSRTRCARRRANAAASGSAGRRGRRSARRVSVSRRSRWRRTRDARARRRSPRSRPARRGTSAMSMSEPVARRRRREPVGVQRRREPDPPHRDERGAEPDRLADVLRVRERRAQDQDRGDEDQVVEEVEPPLGRTRRASSGAVGSGLVGILFRSTSAARRPRRG